MSAGRPTPRKPQPRPGGATVALVALLLGALLSVAIWLGLTLPNKTEADQRPEHVITHDSMTATYTYDGECVRWYVMVDPDTNIQYLYNDHDWTPIPRLDQYGNPMGVSYE